MTALAMNNLGKTYLIQRRYKDATSLLSKPSTSGSRPPAPKQFRIRRDPRQPRCGSSHQG